MKRNCKRRQHFEDDTTNVDCVPIRVTRHAIERYLTRGRWHGTRLAVEREMAESIRGGIDLGLLLRVRGSIHLAAVGDERHRLCAVIDVAGPAQKPFGVTVCTVLTEEMAMNSYGHVPGLIDAMSAPPQAMS